LTCDIPFFDKMWHSWLGVHYLPIFFLKKNLGWDDHVSIQDMKNFDGLKIFIKITTQWEIIYRSIYFILNKAFTIPLTCNTRKENVNKCPWANST